MSTIVPPTTEAQDEIVASLEFHPPCDYREAKDCADAATWAVWSRPCSCGHVNAFRYFCGPCWAYRNSVGFVRCNPCGSIWSSMSLIRRVERI